MKVFLEKAVFINRAPFDRLELDFSENEIAILSAVNGRGKTTLLSHIVDAFYEMARPNFINEFEGKANKFYRISSGINNLDQSQPSFVHFRFRTPESTIDYIDIRGKCTQAQYDSAIQINDKIPLSHFASQLEQAGGAKSTSQNFNQEIAKNIFSQNVLTYFPSYRYERPDYLNDPYQVQIDFNKQMRFDGKLNNPIEVVSGLPQLANWIMDIVLDMSNRPIPQQLQTQLHLWVNINSIVTHALISKGQGPLRFGIGPRGLGSLRIQVMNAQQNTMLYPSIFAMSAGELSTLCIFGEILRQADTNLNDIKLEEITGIVLIDEVDKHLHIKLQKEVLPDLFKLFPNVQFIVSSHSPFLAMGLAEKALNRSKIVNLDNFGISKDPTTNELYAEVYEMMVGENEKFKEMYQTLKQQIHEGTKPLVITEGKTDIQHILKAKEKLNITDLDVDFLPVKGDWGDSKLKDMLEYMAKAPQTRKIIGIFDRDVEKIVVDIEKNGQAFKDYGNNVYAFCLPVPQSRTNYNNISIEFYYTDDELRKEKDGKRVYFTNEIKKEILVSTNALVLTKLPIPDTNSEFIKKVFDQDAAQIEGAHSKTIFASIVENDGDFIQGFNFDNFELIFNRLKQIILLNLNA